MIRQVTLSLLAVLTAFAAVTGNAVAADATQETLSFLLPAEVSETARAELRGRVQRWLEPQQPTLLACYQAALQRDIGPRGGVTFLFGLGPAGAVIEPTIAATDLPEAPFEECLLTAVRGWVLPSAGRSPAWVVYRLRFESRGGPSPSASGSSPTPAASVDGGSKAGATSGNAADSSSGSLDKEVIRRAIRQHLDEVRACYESELTRNTSLTGRVVVMFAISGKGTVPVSLIESSTLANEKVEKCIISAIRNWLFPKPQNGGIVIVTYPFLLKSS